MSAIISIFSMLFSNGIINRTTASSTTTLFSCLTQRVR